MKRLVVLLALVAAALCIAQSAFASYQNRGAVPNVIAPGGTFQEYFTSSPARSGQAWQITDSTLTNVFSTTNMVDCDGGVAAPTGGYCTLTAPTTPGSYYVRFYPYWPNTAGQQAIGITVSAGTVKLTPSGSSPNSVTFSWQNMPNLTATLALRTSSAPGAGAYVVNNGTLDVYASNCSKTGGGPTTSGSCTFALPTDGSAQGVDFRYTVSVQGASSTLGHAVVDGSSLSPIWDEKTNDDDQLWYTYDNFGWYHPLNYQDSSAWPQNCDNGTGGWAFCNIPWDGTHATYICGSYGSILDGSNNCLTRGGDFAGSEGPGVYEGDTSTESSTSTLWEPCCAKLVQLPSGDVFFIHGNGYIHIPSDADAENDGLHRNPGSNVWYDSNGVPAAQLRALPLPYLGEDIGCGCGPIAPVAEPVDTTQACCPSLVELPDGSIYQYDAASDTYLLIPPLSNYGTLSGVFGGYCVGQSDTLGDPGDFCGVTYLPTLPRPVSGTKKLQFQVSPLGCRVENLGLLVDDEYIAHGANLLLASAIIRCWGGEGSLRFSGKICIEKDVDRARQFSCEHVTDYPFETNQTVPLSVIHTCNFTTATTGWYAFVKGTVTDINGDEAFPYDITPRLIVEGIYEHPGGCD